MQKNVRLKERLVFRRNRLNLTQVELAARSNISPRSISDYERGLSEPSASQLQKLAQTLDVKISWLLGEDESSDSALRETPATYESNELLSAIDDAQKKLVIARRLAEKLRPSSLVKYSGNAAKDIIAALDAGREKPDPRS